MVIFRGNTVHNVQYSAVHSTSLTTVTHDLFGKTYYSTALYIYHLYLDSIPKPLYSNLQYSYCSTALYCTVIVFNLLQLLESGLLVGTDALHTWFNFEPQTFLDREALPVTQRTILPPPRCLLCVLCTRHAHLPAFLQTTVYSTVRYVQYSTR